MVDICLMSGLSLGFGIPVNIPQILGDWQTEQLGEYKPFKDISWPTLHPGCNSELMQIEDQVSTSEVCIHLSMIISGGSTRDSIA